MGSFKYLFSAIIGLLLFSVSSLSAQVQIKGYVYNEDHEPLEDVLVMLHQASDSAVIRYTLTDTHGIYNLEYVEDDFNFLISISRLGIKKQIKKIVRRNQEINFIAESNIKTLKEVEIIAEKQWRTGDTLNILIPAYINRNDAVIGDVMRRIPGMRVSENGTISYRGRMIRSLQVEGVDMANGRYGVLTNTISARDVYVIQVLDSYQPIKILKKTHYTDDIALNIKMIRSAKGTKKVNSLLGIGGDFRKKMLWQGEALGMYIGNKHQHLLSYKTNNSGIDVRREQGSNSNYFPINRTPFTYLIMPTSPDINLKHYFFNNTHALTLQNHYKTNDSTDCIYNLRYNFNEEKRKSFSRTSYSIPGEEVRVVEEDISTIMNTHKLEGDVLYKYNTEKTYLNNYLNVAGIWDDGKGSIATNNLLEQKYASRSVEAVNNTHFIKKKRNGENGIDLNLTQAFLSKPHELTITPGLYPKIFNNNEGYNALQQQVQYNTFASGNKLSFLNAITFRGISLNPTINLNLQRQSLSSNLNSSVMENSPLRIIEDPTKQNATSSMRTSLGVALELLYNIKRVNINLKLPLSYNWFYLNNKFQNSTRYWKRWYFQPELYMHIRMNRQWSVSTSTRLEDYTPDLRKLYSGYILQNYRTLNVYKDSNYEEGTANTSTRLSYRNANKQFFSNLSFAYGQSLSNGIYGQEFDGNLSAMRLKMQKNKAQSYRLLWDLNKGINWQQLLISIQASVGKSNRDLFRQNHLITAHSEWALVKLSARMMVSGLSLIYSSEWYGSVAHEDNNKKHPAMHTLNNSLRVDLKLFNNINLFSSGDYYFTKTRNGDKHFSIFDIGAQYTSGSVKYSIFWNNILNTKYYISSYYHNMNSYYTEYTIRPASLMLKVQFNLF